MRAMSVGLHETDGRPCNERTNSFESGSIISISHDGCCSRLPSREIQASIIGSESTSDPSFRPCKHEFHFPHHLTRMYAAQSTRNDERDSEGDSNAQQERNASEMEMRYIEEHFQQVFSPTAVFDSESEKPSEYCKAAHENDLEYARILDDHGMKGINSCTGVSCLGMIAFFQGRDGLTCSHQRGYSPLMIASFRGHIEFIRFLLMKGEVDKNVQDEHGNSALLLATLRGHVKCVEVLIQNSTVNVNVMNDRVSCLQCSEH